jgi:hypothetical protein
MKNLLIAAILILSCIASTLAQNVYIPDAFFKAALVNNSSINTNMDTAIQVSEANAYSGSINVSNLGILDLTGIESFVALDSLICSGGYQNSSDDPWGSPFGKLASLDVSKNKALTYLNCSNNPLNLGLKISGANALKYLDCSGHFNYSQYPGEPIWFQLGSLLSLDVSSNKALQTLNCSLNKIDSLIVSGATALSYLNCSNNNLKKLDVSGAKSLTYLNCSNMPECNSFNQLTSLDVSENSALINLSCNFNQLTSLDVTGDTALTNLFCVFNRLKNLDFSTNKALDSVNCSSNHLTSLNCKNGNNLNHGFFLAKDNGDLTCIQIDDVEWSTINWFPGEGKIGYIDVTAHYSQNCNVTAINTIIPSIVLTMYPNPTTGKIFISQISNIVLTDLIGKVLLQNENTNQLDISVIPSGMYLLSVGDNLKQTFKVIKE